MLDTAVCNGNSHGMYRINREHSAHQLPRTVIRTARAPTARSPCMLTGSISTRQPVQWDVHLRHAYRPAPCSSVTTCAPLMMGPMTTVMIDCGMYDVLHGHTAWPYPCMHACIDMRVTAASEGRSAPQAMAVGPHGVALTLFATLH
jgi:hypothetical protein